MSKVNNEAGFIYIYPVIQGSENNLCKIGVTNDLDARMKDHVRRPYQNFTCFLKFPSLEPIVTAFSVKNMNIADKLVRNYFKEYQIASFEIYNINYYIAIQELYNLLCENNQYVNIKEDMITDYSFLTKENEVKIDTRKEVFEKIRDKILDAYPEKFPDELLSLLREIDEYKTHVYSHYKTGNYVIFRDSLVLDICISKPGRALLLKKLEKFTKNDLEVLN